jgi:hypothetical protein
VGVKCFGYPNGFDKIFDKILDLTWENRLTAKTRKKELGYCWKYC